MKLIIVIGLKIVVIVVIVAVVAVIVVNNYQNIVLFQKIFLNRS
jgi:Tfp pilus assembly protein PilE